MRLTLRTLLAYLDNILESDDADDISKRVQESETASSLMHRIRDVMRRLRLEAPGVDESQGGLDANTVAEYLDHVLPDDRVPDFERICLESDMQLAEVASCHQILALVLGEPAEVDPTSREHMYALPQVASELEAMETRDTAEPDDGRPSTVPPPPPRRPRPVVPDYLREPAPRRRSRLPWAVAVVVLIGLGAVGWIVADHYKLFDKLRPVATGTPSQAAPAPAQPTSGPPAPVTPPTGAGAPSQPTGTTPVPIQQLSSPATAPGLQPVGGPAVAPPGTTFVPAGPAEPPSKEQDQPGEPASQPPTNSGPETPAAPAGPPQLDIITIDSTMAPAPVEGAASGPPEAPAQAAAGAVELGGFASDISDGQLLLQRDPATRAWNRVPPKGSLASGHDLLATPAFRPSIALATGLTLQLRGGTRIGLESADGEEIPIVVLKYGRMVVRTEGEPDTKLRFEAGDHSGTLTFVDSGSRVAIEMLRTPQPGADPEKEPAEPIVNVYALSGQMTWESADELAKIEFKTPSRLTLGPAGAAAAVPIEQFPKWYLAGSMGNLDRRASKTLEKAVPVGRSVTLGLKEQLDHRQIEVRRLAARSLGFVGDFKPLVAGLDRPEEKPLWTWIDHTTELREALARGPETAAEVREALRESFGDDGDKVYRILWGYSADQIINGQDAVLVEALASDLLAMRVLSYQNLRALTRWGLYYRPDDPELKRERAVKAWRKRQEKGELRLKAAERGKPARPRGASAPKPPQESVPQLEEGGTPLP